jgi:diaminohydroxyphosphoribosylaminopyrimidine deaminase/5-amino-6-(5-phosphoribosylamino)uracil reductase
MKEALALAARARGRTSPNPMVGAVVVGPDGEAVGRGFHERAGEPHAEVLALREAGERARGATLYINLEPCSHQGKTPPCAPAVVEAGISRVIAAVRDPDPRVSGKGFEILRRGGVQVEEGLCARGAVRLNEAFFHSIQTGRPLTTLKMAMSLDGKIAMPSGESRWITGEAARARGHDLRNEVDAILVGVETLIQDDPLLTARPEGAEGKPLIRVVLDSRLRSPVDARALPPDRGVATIVAAAEGYDPEKAKKLEDAGAEVLSLEAGKEGRPRISALLAALSGRGVRHLLVEGGGRVHGSFLREGLADKVMAFVAPLIIGDEAAPGAVSGAGFGTIEETPKLSHLTFEVIGDDLLIQSYLKELAWAEFED